MPGPARLPINTPQEVMDHVNNVTRVPAFDPTLGRAVTLDPRGVPKNRLVVIGDSLTQGFQSGAIFNTDISYGAIIAHELGWFDQYRYPRYPAFGGLPLNIEFLLREIEDSVGPDLSIWEAPRALFRARHVMDEIEDYWERGAGSVAPETSAINHCLAVYGWDMRDALQKTAESCESAILAPKSDAFRQVVENNSERAALRVYPRSSPEARKLTLFGAAKELGDERDAETDCGIETLIVFLGPNNVLQSVTDLKVSWTGPDYADLDAKSAYTVWCPEHFKAEYDLIVEQVRKINARHVIWCTVPHVTIPPVSRGLGLKLAPGSRYYLYYARPWVNESRFNARSDAYITGQDARAIDVAIDMYNETIERAVADGRDGTDGTPRDWYLLDIAGLLDRLATRRYIDDPSARPDWWTPYELPPALKALDPEPNSRFLTSDGKGGRSNGGLFSLDGVHPTTVSYGVIAQEMINIMRRAGVVFNHANGGVRADPVTVDFDRLILRDTLIRTPPQVLGEAGSILGWADQTLDLIRRALTFR